MSRIYTKKMTDGLNPNQRYYRRHQKEVCNKIKKYRDSHPKVKERQRLTHLERQRNIRKKILFLLGNKCINCSESDFRCLQIDHVNGGGTTERKKFRNQDLYFHILKEIKKGSAEYQCLCANCNWKKRYNEELGDNKI